MLHDDELVIDDGVLTALLSEQYPDLVERPRTWIVDGGTVNAMVRLGDELVARLPLRPSVAGDLEAELVHLRALHGRLPIEIPRVVAVGAPSDRYPCPWAVFAWIPGERWPVAAATPSMVADLIDAIAAIDALDPSLAPAGSGWRAQPLADTDAMLRPVIDAGDGSLWSAPELLAVWEDALAAPGPVEARCVHADLLAANLVVDDGRLRAVIDWGCFAFGDPAVELGPLWSLLDAGERTTLRRRLEIDDARWRRGRGYGLAQAVFALPYYLDTHPGMVAMARRQLRALLEG